jgi:hypothetical protein
MDKIMAQVAAGMSFYWQFVKQSFPLTPPYFEAPPALTEPPLFLLKIARLAILALRVIGAGSIRHCLCYAW